MRKDLVLVIASVLLIILGEYVIFWSTPRAYWTFKGETALGFKYEKVIPEMSYPLRDFGLTIFGSGLILLCIGLIVSINMFKPKGK